MSEGAHVSATVVLTPKQIAEAFCELSDDDQAQVLIEVARLAQGWKSPGIWQWNRIGEHLRTCRCSTPAARRMVEAIYEGMTSDE